ncbi:MAG: caspase family protein, partial [Crocosphaera sp.]
MSRQWEALIVGIDRYPSQTTLSDLTSGVKDGEDLCRLLTTYGYETFRIQRLPQQVAQRGEENITGSGLVTSEMLQHKIRCLFNPPVSDPIPEMALLFFSGHGWRNFVDGKEDVFLATSDVFPAGNIYGVSLSWLGEEIQRSKVEKIIVWLDCCFSGELLKYVPDNKDYCLITATRSFETGLEISYEQGLFTGSLLRGLNPHNDADGIIDSHKLKEFIEKEMNKTSQRPLIANSEGSLLLTTKYNDQYFIDQCPYRSLNYFTERREDARVFYGRLKLTSILIERVKKDRFIAVLGASGSGKSSLLRAGLLYQLKLGQMITGSNLWTFLSPFTPTENPFQQLENVGWVEETKPNFMKSELRTQKSEVGINKETPIIMIIDQFEECFTMCTEDSRKAFFERLIELLDSYPHLHIIMGMRSDFRGRLREYSNLVAKITKPYINVEHLNREEIEEVIIKPAEKVGLLIEGSLKQQLINDVSDYPGSLPLLQYTLTQLWQETREQGERFLMLKTYQDLGGIEGTLNQRADQVFNSLDANERAIAKRIFLELTQVGDTFDTRRRVYLHELVNKYHSFKQLDEVTRKLANKHNRLLVRDQQEEGQHKWKSNSKFLLLFLSQVSPYLLTSLLLRQQTPNYSLSTINYQLSTILIDVVHEALIRNWGMLRKWQDDYGEGMIIERKIEAAAREWEDKGKKTSDLLQGSKLAEAEGYLKDFSTLGMLDGMAEEYVELSQTHRRNVRRNWWIGGILGGTILSLLTIWATISSLQSQKQALNAELQEQGTKIMYGLSVEATTEELIQAIATTAKSQDKQKDLQPKVINEVNSSLLAALDQVRERHLLEGHTGEVYAIAFSPDGKQILSGS